MARRLITQRAQVGATDSIDWKNIAGNNKPLLFDQDHVFRGRTSGGISFRILHPSTLVRKQQGLTPSAQWPGNFKKGDAVLHTNVDPGPLVLVFGAPVRAAGAQIQSGGVQPNFEAFLTVVDFTSTGTIKTKVFSLPGVSNNNNNNSAIFIGVESDAADIHRIEFKTLTLDPPVGVSINFAINRLDLRF